MNEVVVEEDFLSDSIKVRVNGKILQDSKGIDCTFENSFAAAIAGAKEVDRQRGTPPQRDKP